MGDIIIIIIIIDPRAVESASKQSLTELFDSTQA